MDIEEAKARLARIGGAPSGTIPVTELKAVSERVLSLGMINFCLKFFPKGRVSPRGGYWEAGKVWLHLRDGGEIVTVDFYPKICLQYGGFINLEDPKSGYPIPGSNPLTLYMIAQNIVLTSKLKCLDKADLERSVKNLNKWCDEFETEMKESIPITEYQKRLDEERLLIRLLIWRTIEGYPVIRRSAKKILELVRERWKNDVDSKFIFDLGALKSHYRLYELLERWAKEDQCILFGLDEPSIEKHFLVSKVERSKVSQFLLDPEFTV
jgi:hypothetical protein